MRPIRGGHTTPSVFVVFALNASGRRKVGLASVDDDVSFTPHATNDDGIGYLIVADNGIAETITFAFMTCLVTNESVNISC